MPIRAELRHLYGREWRTVTRPRILARAGGRFSKKTGRYLGGARCEQCGKPDRRRVMTSTTQTLGEIVMFWRHASGSRWHDHLGQHRRHGPFGACVTPAHLIRVILTVAHLNHIAGQDDDENLKALCQWCHLQHDRQQHMESRATRKDAARPLLAAIEEHHKCQNP